MLLSVLAALGQHTSFKQCVTQNAPGAPVITRDDPSYAAASKCLNRRGDIQGSPDAIVKPPFVFHVKETVKCAGLYGLQMSVRSGAHGLENDACFGHVIVDVADLMTFEYDPFEKRATWGAGFTHGELYSRLSGLSPPMTFPGGMEPIVGTSGLVLGCGRGLLTQYLGLSCDRLMEIEYVDVSGEVRYAGASSNSEMLWLARGGGGEFPGVITKFTALLAPEPTTIHTRQCDQNMAIDRGINVITEWTKALSELMKSERKTSSFVSLFPNANTVWVTHKCFDCNTEELAWFETYTSQIAANSVNGGTCGVISDHSNGDYSSQLLNMFASQPGALSDPSVMSTKPNTWAGVWCLHTL